MSNVLMKCGHTAMGTDTSGQPICVMCAGIKAGARQVETAPILLGGRMAKCTCGTIKPSSKALPFFQYAPEWDHDWYYCGHAGWE